MRDVEERQAALSAREREIIELLADGLTGEEVAERLVLSTETVKTHIRNALNKLEARNRVHGVAIALREGHIPGGVGSRGSRFARSADRSADER